jgi:hypothetical protein
MKNKLIKGTIFLILLIGFFSIAISMNNNNKNCCSKKCTGGEFCFACKNCSGCAYCKSGGYCGKCRPDKFKTKTVKASPKALLKKNVVKKKTK